METIKLIIWDMDETFWKGTLSDGEVQPIQENIEIVKRLTDRGIVNSICSKNDFDKTKEKLVEMGIWDYFVFPSIDWTSKGIRVKNIISDIGLRPVNVLFLDDNINNLKEAQYECPALQVATPDKLAELIKDPAFDGKDDSSHSRLNQYKILEKKAEARQQSSSNEEFLYQSDIHVELIEDCSDKLQRIHEMIHRNNQLNFTKDRISREEVDNLFTDNSVRKGVVHVTDKYGDHGIIGCYAIKDNVAKQFVFSCRILGMGVEQWVYAELEYPEITVVGEVANQLNKTDKPAWINQTEKVNSATCTTGGGTATPRLIVYGTCPLRPVWGYLQPKLPNAKFAEIDPAPPIGNLAVAFREDREYLDDLCKKVNIFDAVNTFDRDIVDGKADYLLITISSAYNAWKYTLKGTDKHFYSSVKLTETMANSFILENYNVEPISFDDIKAELNYLCEHLRNTKLIIQNAPEVVFSQGKDSDYYDRIKLNEIIEYVCSKYSNVKIVDIRKYAKTTADFFDPIPSHYNRAIGYNLAQEVFDIMRVNINEESRTCKNTIPSNTIYGKALKLGKTGDSLSYTAFIRNGYFNVKFDLIHSEKYNVKLEFNCSRHKEAIIAVDNKTIYKFAVNKTGLWYICFVCEEKSNPKVCHRVQSCVISYNIYNYIEYLDPDEEDYESFISTVDQLCNNSYDVEHTDNIACKYLTNLLAVGVNITDYFIENNINDITIFINKSMAQILLPFFYNSSVRVKNVITVDWQWIAWVNGGCEYYDMQDFDGFLNDKRSELTSSDTIFYAVSWRVCLFYSSILRKTPAKELHIENVLNNLYTKTFFINRFNKKNSPKVIVVRCPNLMAYAAFPYSKVKPNERTAHTNLKNADTALTKIDIEFDKFPAQYKGISKEELKETLVRPMFYRDNFKIQKMRDKSGKYFNIKDGYRVTTGQPENYDGTIYIVGNSIAYGCGNKDSDTIASKLQRLIGEKYRVENRANMYTYGDDDMGYADAINMIDNINAGRNDLIVFLINNWRSDNLNLGLNYPLWEAIEEPIIKVDAFPLFEKQDRPDYFLLPEAYTAEANQAIAELLAETIRNVDKGIAQSCYKGVVDEEQNIINNWIKKYNNLNTENNELKGDYAVLNKSYIDIEESLSRSQQHLQQSLQENEELKSQKEVVESELNKLTEKYSATEQEKTAIKDKLSQTRKELEEATINSKNLYTRLSDMEKSLSFRTGRAITYIPRKIRDLFKKK